MVRVVLGLAVPVLLGAVPALAWSPPKREPDAKLRGCPEIGEGYVRVPGSDTCVKLGGLVRVEGMKQGSTR